MIPVYVNINISKCLIISNKNLKLILHNHNDDADYMLPWNNHFLYEYYIIFVYDTFN